MDLHQRCNGSRAAHAGAVVKVADPRGRPLGTAHYSSSSQIALRMLTDRLKRSTAIFTSAASAPLKRIANSRPRTDAYRVVHAEADLLPALIVDRYGDYLVMQTLDQGMDAAKETIVVPGRDLPAARHRGAQRCAGARQRGIAARNTTMSRRGSRCGLAADERSDAHRRPAARTEDRHLSRSARKLLAAARYARGGRALDCFTSTGGFALHLAAKCESVEAVDSSAPALERGPRQCRRNGIANVEFPRPTSSTCWTPTTAPAASFPWWCSIRRHSPNRASNLEAAGGGYKEINLRACVCFRPGGVS